MINKKSAFTQIFIQKKQIKPAVPILEPSHLAFCLPATSQASSWHHTWPKCTTSKSQEINKGPQVFPLDCSRLNMDQPSPNLPPVHSKPSYGWSSTPWPQSASQAISKKQSILGIPTNSITHRSSPTKPSFRSPDGSSVNSLLPPCISS